MANPFLPWEVKLYCKYLGYDPGNFVDPQTCQQLQLAITLKMYCTVNMARQMLGKGAPGQVQPHPDPVRGALQIWQDDTLYQVAADLIIPQAVKNNFPGIQWDPGD